MSTITSGISVKITGEHLDRLAIVYVRQSTLAQVRDHGESTQRQYALSDDAERMGWPAERVLVIDADLGVSGRGGSARAGFKELVGRVCCGEVGAVFGLEVSRLARSTADLQRLLELCSLTDTLIIDGDGVYDLGQFNDRMLLGLKGTMSEAELHFIKARLRGVLQGPDRNTINAQSMSQLGTPHTSSDIAAALGCITSNGRFLAPAPSAHHSLSE